MQIITYAETKSNRSINGRVDCPLARKTGPLWACCTPSMTEMDTSATSRYEPCQKACQSPWPICTQPLRLTTTSPALHRAESAARLHRPDLLSARRARRAPSIGRRSRNALCRPLRSSHSRPRRAAGFSQQRPTLRSPPFLHRFLLSIPAHMKSASLLTFAMRVGTPWLAIEHRADIGA